MSDSTYNLDHLTELEAESIYVLREVAAQFDRPPRSSSREEKDSIVVTHLAAKAFAPGRIPMPLVHIDTGHNFPETIEFRDNLVERLGARLIVGSVQATIDSGKVQEETGANAEPQSPSNHHPHRHHRRTPVRCLHRWGTSRRGKSTRQRALLLPPRRLQPVGSQEPASRAVEPLQRHARAGEHFRVFPLNNWTELDVWNYILRENIALPSLYYAHDRMCIRRAGQILAHSDHLNLRPDETPEMMHVRFRTLGDLTITGAFESDADTLEQIIDEVAATRITERGGRMDDKRSESAMEDRKKEGYF